VLRRDPVARLEAQLADVWGPSDRRCLVRWPITIRAGRP
jgi:hypothetical protein